MDGISSENKVADAKAVQKAPHLLHQVSGFAVIDFLCGSYCYFSLLF
jgi:hypothetical protein